MKIVRIKKLTQIGAFRNFKGGGSIPFSDGKNISVVFGRNTKGKSTFVSILKSLGEADSTAVLDRRSIPRDPGVDVEVEISYTSDEGVEKTAKFQNGVWNSNGLVHNVLVYDQDFVHRNVVSGSSITRDNREQFTDFILGADGVRQSEVIESKKKQLRTKKGGLPGFRPMHVKGAPTEKIVNEFVNLKVTEDTPTLEKDKESLQKRLARIDRVDEFSKLSEPEMLSESAETAVNGYVESLTNILAENYKTVSEESWQTLRIHVENNCGSEESIAWLKKGLQIGTAEKCPYCAQDLTGAQKLIATYQSVFDEKFEVYESDLKRRIEDFREYLQLEGAKSYLSPVNKYIQSVVKFAPFIPELEAETNQLQTSVETLTFVEEEYRRSLARWITDAEAVLRNKELSTFKPLENPVDASDLLASAKRVAAEQMNVRSIADRIGVHLKSAKQKVSKLTPEQLVSERQRLTKEINSVATKMARLGQDAECVVYKQQIKEIDESSKEIVRLTDELEKEQSQYLSDYFKRLDYWFKRLGSDAGFEISKSTNRKGDKKVYSLILMYNGQQIPVDQISKVFSESDKRNLALSVFMSRAERLEDKQNKILVLDDPVVSFDDNRIQLTCRELKNAASEFGHLIVTTHYSSLVKEAVSCLMDATYIKIESEGKQSHMEVLEAPKLVQSSHERECDRICAFVDGGRDDGILLVLRPFMEEHLHIRYQQQIIQNSLGELGLGDLINGLEECEVISGNAARQLHTFRQSLNPDHHRTIDDENVEQIRIEARDLLSLIYEDLKTL